MMRTLPLRQEPTVRQQESLMSTIERELVAVGATCERSAKGGLTFRMPAPWRAAHLGLLLAITSGRTMVSAGEGGPWRVRYELNFLTLRILCFTTTIILVALEWNRSRLALLNELIALWGLGYFLLHIAATNRFQRIIEVGAKQVMERRSKPRMPGEPNTGEGPKSLE